MNNDEGTERFGASVILPIPSPYAGVIQMSKEQDQKRETYYQKVLALLERNNVLEVSRLVVIEARLSLRRIVKVLGYDHAFFRVKTTGCAYGRHWPEEQAFVYRNHESGLEEFIKWSDLEKVEPYTGTFPLPTQEETNERLKAWYAARCCEYLPHFSRNMDGSFSTHFMICLRLDKHQGEHSFGPHFVSPEHYEWAGIDLSIDYVKEHNLKE